MHSAFHQASPSHKSPHCYLLPWDVPCIQRASHLLSCFPECTWRRKTIIFKETRNPPIGNESVLQLSQCIVFSWDIYLNVTSGWKLDASGDWGGSLRQSKWKDIVCITWLTQQVLYKLFNSRYCLRARRTTVTCRVLWIYRPLDICEGTNAKSKANIHVERRKVQDLKEPSHCIYPQQLYMTLQTAKWLYVFFYHCKHCTALPSILPLAS